MAEFQKKVVVDIAHLYVEDSGAGRSGHEIGPVEIKEIVACLDTEISRLLGGARYPCVQYNGGDTVDVGLWDKAGLTVDVVQEAVSEVCRIFRIRFDTITAVLNAVDVVDSSVVVKVPRSAQMVSMKQGMRQLHGFHGRSPLADPKFLDLLGSVVFDSD